MSGLQRTDEWFAARLGKLTGSRMADATARIKSGWGASRDDYKEELLYERRYRARWPNNYINSSMQHGIDQEANGIAKYEFERNTAVIPVGFIEHPRIKNFGASPDGLVGDDGSVELKCPDTKTHWATLRGAPIKGRYLKQVYAVLSVTGRQWCDWVSFDPRIPEPDEQIVIRRVERDNAAIAELEAEAVEFLEELAREEASGVVRK